MILLIQRSELSNGYEELPLKEFDQSVLANVLAFPMPKHYALIAVTDGEYSKVIRC